jgi:hypothetical protein
MWQACDIGAAGNATALGKINAFLTAGGKVIINDADGCATGTLGPANYSNFLIPFGTNNPGPNGAVSQYTFAEADALTQANAGQPALAAGQSIPSGGDSNVFTTSDARWCGADSTLNVNGVNGWTQAYTKPGAIGNNGLAVYMGEDRYVQSDVPLAHAAQLLNNSLSAAVPGSNFPCTFAANKPPPNALLPTPKTAATTGGVRNILAPNYPILAAVGILGLVVLAATGLELARRRRS